MRDERKQMSLNIQEVKAPDLRGLANVFLNKRAGENANDEADTDKGGVGQLLNYLNNEYHLNTEIARDYHLLWFRDEEVIGLVKVTEIQHGMEARAKFVLFEGVELGSAEIESSLISSVEKVFRKLHLQRLIITVDHSNGNDLHGNLLYLYKSFPIGFVHFPMNIREYVIVKDQKVQELYDSWFN